MDPWYKVTQLRREVSQGRSFNPDEFAIALEQVVAKTAPEDYRDPQLFFARTCFTRALREHVGIILRRLAGQSQNAPPVCTLVTQFGGGKTHTLTALYHLVSGGVPASDLPGVADVIREAGLTELPKARVAVFVGNAWDPQAGRETPWIDLARQLSGDAGVALLGPAAKESPPGTEALGRVFHAAGGSVLVLCDEVLNFVNRHKPLADRFYSFLQNLTVAMTGTERSAAVISLPRSQVEMTKSDEEWTERINKIVRRVATDLISNDEAEIGEVVRRRLFENLGPERTRRSVARTYADWCFERRSQLPPEWTSVDSARTEKDVRSVLQERFEAAYPFHPATLSVFQRKWQALPQYQRTRGTLAMLAQWISYAALNGFTNATDEPLITLGSAPLRDPRFRGVVLGQCGDDRLTAAIDADIAGDLSHASALDSDQEGKPGLSHIHQRVGTAIFFECSGGQREKVAHEPELRFALGQPGLDTTTIDTAAAALEACAFFVRRVGTDGYQIKSSPTLKKVVNDRRASLDAERDVLPAMRGLVEQEFRRGSSLPVHFAPIDAAAIGDLPRLSLIVLDPQQPLDEEGETRNKVAAWTRQGGTTDRLYPAALVWCAKKASRDLREKVETWLAWDRAVRDLSSGALGTEIDGSDRRDAAGQKANAQEAAREQVWADYRHVLLWDAKADVRLRSIDLGVGHAHGSDPLSARILGVLVDQGLLSREGVGAGYVDRNWPPALRDSQAWPLSGLRQSFLNGSLIRLVDPDAALKSKILEWVERGEFGLASGSRPDGTYERLWYREAISGDEVDFRGDTVLLRRERAQALKAGPVPRPAAVETPQQPGQPTPAGPAAPGLAQTPPLLSVATLRVTGTVPPNLWNKFGLSLLTKLREGAEGVQVRVDLAARFPGLQAASRLTELRQIIQDLGLADALRVEQGPL